MDRPCIPHEQRRKSAPNPLELTKHKDPAAALYIAIRSTKTNYEKRGDITLKNLQQIILVWRQTIWLFETFLNKNDGEM